ncbi:ABC transporter cdr4 [Stagonosporopsis vannaccii]|nr:ABC transporter cdr4 [Stagonosporopsis vannaccii]
MGGTSLELAPPSYTGDPASELEEGTVQRITRERTLGPDNTTTTSVPRLSGEKPFASTISEQILEIIFDYALNKFSDTKERLEAGRPKFLSVIDGFIATNMRLEMCLPAFPFKSANKVYKVLGVLPDKAEEIALDRLNTMCMRIGEIYNPGARCTIISDGLVYNDLLSISDRDTWAYGQGVRAMAVEKGFQHIAFSRLRDFVDFPMPEKLEEITYVANAMNFRRFIFNRYGNDNIDIDHEIATDPDTKMTYLGYKRFLESDLKHIFPIGNGRSSNGYKRDVKYLAKQMLIRGYAFAGAVKAKFPGYLRLSIHQSTGEHKISMSLLNTKTGFTTPWHCSVALTADGEWISAPMGEFQKDHKMEIVYENERPSYFREKVVNTNKVMSEHYTVETQFPNPTADAQQQIKSVAELLSVNDADMEKITAQATQLSADRLSKHSSKGGSPFLGTGHALLDPNSTKFDLRAWLQAVMSLAARDSERYPKGVAGVAYKNLGCSTFLKTISGEINGFTISPNSHLNYQGISKETMHKDFRGECIYQAEVDAHFPQLTVGQTLEFAARARAPRNLVSDCNLDTYVTHLRDVVLAALGLKHTVNTIVGNDFIRGVSGGERKRVSIAEAAIGGSALQCWDNSTRGLDSSTALEFVRTVRISTELTGATALVTLYQASESIYNVFDKVSLLYEGRQIYFGDIHKAKIFFTDLGFECPSRQTTPDFLTSLTNPSERRVNSAFMGRTPSTPDEFAAVWRNSSAHARLLQDIEEFDQRYPIGGQGLDEFKNYRRTVQAKSQRLSSPYNLSLPQQVALCTRRGFQRLKGDMGLVIMGAFFNAIMALVIGSIFYDLPNNTGALYSRGALLFFAILLASFASAIEILTLYAQRPIVEKQSKYAFYHPFAEAISSMLCDLPNKIITALAFNLTLYFMTNLRRTPGHVFTFLLFAFTCTLTMSMYFRCIAALSRSLPEALVPASLFSLCLAIYTGFSIPIKDMKPWFRWLNYLNPVAYAFEALMINEFHGRTISCSTFIPNGADYNGIEQEQRICATTGATAGADFVDGDTYLAVNFEYHYRNLWRNLGIMVALMIFGCGVYLFATESISAKRSRGEILVFRQGSKRRSRSSSDEEASADDRFSTEMLSQEKSLQNGHVNLYQQTSVFQWSGVNYDIKVKKQSRRLLADVDGWVKPGTLTALMGVTGAGKTTLLDVLADRINVGIVSGEFLVNGQLRNTSFQRKTGYVQQQDLHLATTTVREALMFSAMLRQSSATSIMEKAAYVEEVIKILEMEWYADAIVGTPGEGLNIEQRKRLSIGVELVAKPKLLLFLDEPTSGLDSQTAWSICTLLRKLADNGQAILCTIHQPSSHLFEAFDRLLLLAMEGKTLYFGDIGASSRTVMDYFKRKGAPMCAEDDNPADWLMRVTGASTEVEVTQDWHAIWRDSDEYRAVKAELALMKTEQQQLPIDLVNDNQDSSGSFANSLGTQLVTVLKRGFQQYWRTPSYLYSKLALCLLSALFIGFSFYKMPNSLQGLQNQMYAIFMLLVIFTNVCTQIMPQYASQLELYEARESPSKTYSWAVFVLSNLLVEIPWNTISALLIFVAWYYPIGLRRNAAEAGQTTEREGLMFLYILSFLNFAGTFTNMVMAAVRSVDAAGNITNLLHSLSLIFCGVLALPETLPRFWIFMYRVSPFTYFFSGVLSTGLGNSHISCSPEEYLHFSPPPSTTCSTYLAAYIENSSGYLTPESMGSTSECVLCSGDDTNIFLKGVSANYNDRWRNYGIFWVYIIFNTAAAVGLFWLTKVPKGRRQ